MASRRGRSGQSAKSPGPTPDGAGHPRPGDAQSTPPQAPPRRARWVTPTMVAVVLVLLTVLYLVFQSTTTVPATGAGGRGYQVGDPGVGATAPLFTLASTTGKAVRLQDYHGKTVLLYFHEGLGCQPCWDQIRDLDANASALKTAGVDQLVTLTSGPRDLIAQKMSDDKLTAVALADTDLTVSRQYNANRYGMMGTDRDGHSFILVGPDGRIQWRADYGGAPRYTMYVPVPRLLADLKAGRRSG